MSASAGIIAGGRRPRRPSAGGPDERRPPASDAGGARAVAVPDRPAAPTAPAPVRAGGLQLLGEVAGSGYRRPPALVRRADGQTVQLTPILFRLLEAIDGKRGYAALATTLSERIGKHATAEDVRFLVETRLRPLGLLRRPDGTDPKVEKANPLLGLRLKFIVSNPDVTRRITAPFVPLFRPPVVAAVLAAFAAAAGWIALEKGLASAVHQALYQPGLLLLVLALTLVSAGFHEIGHAAACRYGGARPGGMGVGLYLVWPAFYTDVTDSYRLARRDRLRVDLGGLYFNAIFGVAMLGVWAAVGWDALLLVIGAQIVQMVRQLVPVVRFDGYHILADVIGVPDLFAQIRPILLGLLPTRWGRPETKVLKTWARAVVTLWVLVVVPLLAALLALIVIVFPRIVATAWDSLALHWEAVGTSWAQGDVSAVGVGLVSTLTICLPVLGITYLLGRVVRRTGEKVWQATAGSPPLRAAAALGGAIVVGAVAWAWWPDGQYRPIDASDRWTLPEVPHLAARGVAVPEPTAASKIAAPTSMPAAPLARAAGPTPQGRWMLVLLPASIAGAEQAAGQAPDQPSAISSPPQPGGEPGPATGTTPAWPFPFDPPRAPQEGDNQAMAVNTDDGSTAFDVALALVWVTDGGPVANRNEAYALASCRGCRTVAVAFQVVLVIGYAQVVTPINTAVALNYVCAECVTHALAVQLVATLARPPSEEAVRELARIWAQLEALSESFSLRPLEEVYGILTATRTSILEILASDGNAVPGSASTAVAEGATADASEDLADDETASSDVQGETQPPPPPAETTGTTDETTTTTATEPTTTAEEATTTATTTTTPPTEDPPTTASTTGDPDSMSSDAAPTGTAEEPPAGSGTESTTTTTP